MTDALDRLAGVGDDLFRRVGDVIARGGLPPQSPAGDLLRKVGALPSDVLEHALRLDVDGLRRAAADLRAVAERFGALPARLAAGVGARSGDARGGNARGGDARGGDARDEVAWEGGAAETFGVVRDALAAHIGEGAEPATITGRVAATAAYLDAVAGWAAGYRRELAEAVGRVAGSAEAVIVLTAGSAEAVTVLTAGAAATAGARPSTGEGAGAGGGATGGAGPEVAAAAGRIVARVLSTAADAIDAADALRDEWAGRLAALEYEPPRVPHGPAVISGVTRANL